MRRQWKKGMKTIKIKLKKRREMKKASEKLNRLRVPHLPPKPLLLFDGNCGFCRKWVGRWRALTGDQVSYEPYQEAAARFPEINPERYKHSLQLIQIDGQVLQGAEAVFTSLKVIIYLRWLSWGYDFVPGVSRLSEWFYRKVAENRNRVWMKSACCKKY
jgi:predicted DCC family thiol-disulfide oxidoreductase YuxK